MSNIVIGHIDISVDLREVQRYQRKDDDILKTAMEEFKEKLDDDTEIFMEDGNIIATEEGYYVTIREKELKKIEDE